MPERDEKGRFVKGTSGGPGRPPRSVEREYLQMLTDAVKPEKWRKIINKAITQAVAGDRHAREWLGNYLVGKPAQTINLNAADQALLKELLDLFESQDVSASVVFQAMMQEIIAESEQSDDE